MGLFLGFSFLTLLDIIFWVVGLCRGMVRNGGRNKSPQFEEEKRETMNANRDVSSFKIKMNLPSKFTPAMKV